MNGTIPTYFSSCRTNLIKKDNYVLLHALKIACKRYEQGNTPVITDGEIFHLIAELTCEVSSGSLVRDNLLFSDQQRFVLINVTRLAMASRTFVKIVATLIGLVGDAVNSDPLNVSLVIISSWDNNSDFSYIKTAPVIAVSVGRLNKEYAGRIFFTAVPIVPPDVVSCEQMERRAAFFATDYLYQNRGRNQTMAFIGPGCSAAVDVVGLASRSGS